MWKVHIKTSLIGFSKQTKFIWGQEEDDATYFAQVDAIEPLEKLIQKYQPRIQNEDKHFLKEFVLWGLVESKKLSKSAAENGVSYRDRFSDYMKGSI